MPIVLLLLPPARAAAGNGWLAPVVALVLLVSSLCGALRATLPPKAAKPAYDAIRDDRRATGAAQALARAEALCRSILPEGSRLGLQVVLEVPADNGVAAVREDHTSSPWVVRCEGDNGGGAADPFDAVVHIDRATGEPVLFGRFRGGLAAAASGSSWDEASDGPAEWNTTAVSAVARHYLSAFVPRHEMRQWKVTSVERRRGSQGTWQVTLRRRDGRQRAALRLEEEAGGLALSWAYCRHALAR